MVALVQPESSRDSGSPQRFIFNTQKNNHLEIAETCADPQITSTQPAARHNQPGQNACAHTRFERKEKGKNKIQHPGIKDWQILSVTTQPRKGREKKGLFRFLLYKKSNDRVLFKSKQMSQRRTVVLLRRVGRDFSPCSGDQWGKIIRVHSTHQGFFFLFPPPPPPPLRLISAWCSCHTSCLQCGQTSGQVKYKQQYSNFKSRWTKSWLVFNSGTSRFFFFQTKMNEICFWSCNEIYPDSCFHLSMQYYTFPPQPCFPELSGALNN